MIPRWLEAILDPALEEDEVDDLYLLDTYYNTDIFPEPETPEWVEQALVQNPLIWTAEVCRIMHNLPSDNQAIAWCGLCSEYANVRKRLRSRALPDILPGFEEVGGAYKLHPPCSKRGLTWLRRLTDRWKQLGYIEKIPMQIIPDSRQARGWDYGTRLKWKKEPTP